MHPILARPQWLALYLGAWIPLGALLGWALSLLAKIPLGESMAVSLGLATVLAFMCLATWYPSRSMPLARSVFV